MTTLATEAWAGTTGAAWPSQWTVTPQNGSVATQQAGAGRITFGAAYALFTKALLNSVAARRDFDITVDIKVSTLSPPSWTYLSARASGATGYYLSIFPHNGTATMGVGRGTPGDETPISGDIAGAGTWTAGVARRVRFSCVGDALKVKVWAPADPEPGAWLWEGTDTTLSAATGQFNITGYSGGTGGHVELDNLVVTDGVASAAAPIVNAGADATADTGAAFTRTATETGTGITARTWKIQSGPAGVGTTIGTAAALSWTPTVVGAYVLRYTATNPTGSGTDDVTVTVAVPPPGPPTLPAQVSRVTAGTTPGGKTIHKYEVGTGVAGLPGQAFVYMSADTPTGSSVKACYMLHGLGGNGAGFVDSAQVKALTARLIDTGWVIISATYETTFGNADAMARLTRTYDYLHINWTVTGEAMHGFSMGGGATSVALHRQPIPVKIAYIVQPLEDYALVGGPGSPYPSEAGQIRAAFGTNASGFAAATADYDPLRQPASDYAGVRVRMALSSDDTYVPRGPHGDALMTLIAPRAADAVTVTTAGGHSDAAQWDNPASVVAWLNAAVAAAPYAPGRLLDAWDGTKLVPRMVSRWNGTALVPVTVD